MCDIFSLRTGCRPFIEIFQGEQRILSTAIEIEQMRSEWKIECLLDFIYDYVEDTLITWVWIKCIPGGLSVLPVVLPSEAG